MIREGTPVRIEWNDTQDYSDDDWNGEVEALVSATMLTYGIAITRVDPSMRDFPVARDRDFEEGTYHGARVIPCGCIVSVRDLSTGAELWDLPKGEE